MLTLNLFATLAATADKTYEKNPYWKSIQTVATIDLDNLPADILSVTIQKSEDFQDAYSLKIEGVDSNLYFYIRSSSNPNARVFSVENFECIRENPERPAHTLGLKRTWAISK